MAISDDNKYILNSLMGPVAAKVQLGTLIEAAEEGGLANDSVSIEHLDSGIEPSHVVKYAGSFTTLGGDATESIAVTGILSTDVALVSIKTAGATPRTLVAAVTATNAITVTLSGDPSTDHVLYYVVHRAAV